jgi:adenosylcobinamide-GDP ribazoletransferase
MKDSAIGTFGVLALIGWAISLTAMLARLHPTQALLALIAAGALSRWAAIVQAVTAPPARSDGLGAGFAPTNAAVILASVTAAVVAVVAGGLVPGLIAIGLVVAVAGGCTAGALWMLGGRTGDTLGATVAIAEVAAVAALLATHS